MTNTRALTTKKSTKQNSAAEVAAQQVAKELEIINLQAMNAADALRNEFVTEDDIRLVTGLISGPIAQALDRSELIFGPMQKAANETVKTIREQRKAIEAPFIQAKDTLRSALSEYEARRRKIAEEAAAAERKLLTEQAKQLISGPPPRQSDKISSLFDDDEDDMGFDLILGDVEQPKALAPLQVSTVSSNSTFRDNYEFTLLDSKSLKEEFKIADLKAVAGVVKSMKGFAVGLVTREGAPPAISVENRPVLVTRR